MGDAGSDEASVGDAIDECVGVAGGIDWELTANCCVVTGGEENVVVCDALVVVEGTRVVVAIFG